MNLGLQSSEYPRPVMLGNFSMHIDKSKDGNLELTQATSDPVHAADHMLDLTSSLDVKTGTLQYCQCFG